MTNRRRSQQPKEPFEKLTKGRLEYKDYTKYIHWTPSKVIIFILCLALPYIGAAIAVGMVTAPYIGILMLAVPGILALLGAGFYWLLKNAG